MIPIDSDKQYYYIDLNKITEYIFNGQEGKRTFDSESFLDKDGNILQQTYTEKDGEEKYINIKYDMIKAMLDVMYNGGVESEDGNVKYIQDLEDTSIGNKLIFNTLLEYEFVKNKLN